MSLLSNFSSKRNQILKTFLIQKFFQEFGRIYRYNNPFYNIHSLIHFYLDCLILEMWWIFKHLSIQKFSRRAEKNYAKW